MSDEAKPDQSGIHSDPRRATGRAISEEIIHTIDDDTTEAERLEFLAQAAASRPAQRTGEINTGAGERPPVRPSRSASPAVEFWDPLRLLAAVATGSSMWISAPDMNVWWLALVGWVPLLWAVDGRPPKHAFFYGWLAGFSAVFVGFFWMSELLTRFAGFGIVVGGGITALFALALGLMWALPTWLTVKLCQSTGRATLLVFPMAWAGFELLMAKVSIFPVHMALSWAWQPVMIQTAELGGALAVSFVMVAINAALWECIRSYINRGRVDTIALAALLGWSLGVPLYGWVRLNQVETEMAKADTLRIGVVQGNFGINTYTTPAMKPLILSELQRETAELDAQGAELVLWGETAYPYARFARQHERDLNGNDRRRIQRGFDVPVIVGLMTRDATGQNPYAWNTAWVLNSDGTWGDRYDKRYPLMFGEAAPPIVDPEWYLEKIPSASHLNRGEGPAPLGAAGYTFGALICYEDILGSYTRDVANEGVHALVNLTNDSWFGKTREQSEHLGLAVFRAVEHRKGLLRSVNAGISAYVDPTGRVVDQLAVTDSDNDDYQGAESFAADVPMMPTTRRTLYGYTGDLFGWLCWLGLGGVAFVARRKRQAPAAAPTA